jgi:hypothetical protein
MYLKVLVLLLTSVLPGLGAVGISGYYVLPEWGMLERSHQNFQTLAAQGQGLRELTIAQAAETRHRINSLRRALAFCLGASSFPLAFMASVPYPSPMSSV